MHLKWENICPLWASHSFRARENDEERDCVGGEINSKDSKTPKNGKRLKFQEKNGSRRPEELEARRKNEARSMKMSNFSV